MPIGSSLRMTGVQAEVLWGYHSAATLGAWEIAFGFLRAAVVRANAFHLTQRPLIFEISNAGTGRPPFQRQLLNVTYTGQTLTARLGPKP